MSLSVGNQVRFWSFVTLAFCFCFFKLEIPLDFSYNMNKCTQFSYAGGLRTTSSYISFECWSCEPNFQKILKDFTYLGLGLLPNAF